jgi:cytochrome c553
MSSIPLPALRRAARALALILALPLGGAALAQAPAVVPAASPPPPRQPFTDTPAQRARACTVCHGEQGRSGPDGYVPRLAGKPEGYLFEQLQAFRDGRRGHRGMARLVENADDATLRELAAHFAGLTLPYPAPSSRAPEGAAAARAERLVRQGLPEAKLPACAACHGESLTGQGPRVPGLLGLPRDYLVGQLGAWRQGLRQGRAPDCMAEVARRLTPQDLTLVADWLAAQPVPAGAPGTTGAGAAVSRRTEAPRPSRPLHGLDCGPDVVVPVAAVATGATPPTAPATAAAPAASPTDLARGAYLARLGNCAGCHQRPGGSDLSGGAPLRTPFGTVHAGNLTPDAATGLGRWSADDFWRAMHEGRGRDGRALLPVFPYASYTHLSREDSDALFAWLRAQPAVTRARPAHELRWPYGEAWALSVWRTLYFRPATPAPAPAMAPTVERGRYLVEGPGHCLECHAPRGRWGARSDRAEGGLMPDGEWWAPSLAPRAGLREDDLVALLRDGRHRTGAAMGPMAAVVARSTRHWSEDDLRATARYLATQRPAPAPRAPEAAEPARLALGEKLYAQRCADCHGERGEGRAPWIVPLAGNPSVTEPRLENLVQALKHGGFGAATAKHPRPVGMPPQALTPAEMAAVLSHIRQAWGNRGTAVSEVELAGFR